jgi:hypothetical protein
MNRGGGSRTRGQTQQDFAVGVSVFLLAVFFVFSFVPTTIAPTDANTESESYVADRIAGSVLETLSERDEANAVAVDRAAGFFANHSATGSIQANYSVAEPRQVNVTLETLQGVTVTVNETSESVGVGVNGTVARAGDDYPGGVGVAASRVVRIDDDRYRIVARVW